MDQITHQLRLEQWTQIIKECTASGMPKKLWLAENGINEKQYYYWQRIVRKEVFSLMQTAPKADIVEVIPTVSPIATVSEKASSTPLVIRFGDVAVEVPDGASADTLRMVIEVFRHA